jgi:outer membrane protein TolC
MALVRSPEALIAEAQALRAREAARESRSLNLPQVVTGTGLAYNNGFPLSIEGAAPSIVQLGAAQPIFSKKNSNLIREAEASAKASQLSKETARNEVAAKTALAYFELFQARKITALASAGLDAADKQRELVETSFSAGKVRPVDVTAAKTAVLAARQDLLVAREKEQLAEAELRELTGLPENVSIQTREPQIDSPALESDERTLFQQALESAPEILQADAVIRAKEFHVEAERGENLPRMELVGQYALFSRSNNYSDYFNRFERNNFLLGLSVQFPLFNGFRTSARVAQSRQEVAEERYRLQGLKSELKLNIQRGLSALRIARGALDLARSDAAAAREMAEVSETLLSTGRIGAKDMENVRTQLRQKELALIEANRILFQRKVEILRLAGAITSVMK